MASRRALCQAAKLYVFVRLSRMTPSADITTAEGDALRDQILTHLEALDDLRLALRDGDLGSAERLGIEFGDELRLMQDLGWGKATPASDAIELTMPPEQLRRVFTRLRSDAESLQAEEERQQAEEQRATQTHRDRGRRVTDACERVLGAMHDGLGGG